MNPNEVAKLLQRIVDYDNFTDAEEDFNISLKVGECVVNDFIVTTPDGKQFKVNVKEVRG